MSLETDLPRIVAMLAKLYEQEGDRRSAQLLSAGQVYLEQTEYDNWNGGTYTYRVELDVPLAMYALIGNEIDRVEDRLLERIQKLIRAYRNEHINSVIISPTLEGDMSGEIPGADLMLPYWKEGFLRLFISHANSERALAAAIRAELAAYGISAFVAHDDIEPTEEWENEIHRALQTCQALLALLTQSYHESMWTDQEIGVAIGRRLLIVPVRLGTDPYGFIGRYQGFPGLGQTPVQLADGIARILARHPRTQMTMTSALVTRFEESESYEAAKRSAAHLELAAIWTDALRTRVREAIKSNSQISDACGVAARVENLIGKQP